MSEAFGAAQSAAGAHTRASVRRATARAAHRARARTPLRRRMPRRSRRPRRALRSCTAPARPAAVDAPRRGPSGRTRDCRRHAPRWPATRSRRSAARGSRWPPGRPRPGSRAGAWPSKSVRVSPGGRVRASSHEDEDRQHGGVVLGYAYSPRVLAHDPPPSTVQIAGRAFTLGSVNVAQAVLTEQAHDLVERSALASRLARLEPRPAPDESLLAVHTAAYLRRLRAASAGGPWDGEYAPVTPATWEAARLTVGGVLAAVDAVLDGGIHRVLVHARPAGTPCRARQSDRLDISQQRGVRGRTRPCPWR